MRGDEILQHGQTFAKVGRDRSLDDLTGGLGHEPAHPSQLANLLLTATGAGVGHDVDGVEVPACVVEPLHLLEHRVGNAFRHVRPDGDDLVVALTVRDRPLQVLLLDSKNLVVGRLHQRGFLGRHDEIVDADRQTGPCRIPESQLLERVEHFDRLRDTVAEIAVLDELAEPLLLEKPVDIRQFRWKRRVENCAPHRRVDQLLVDLLDLGA